MTQLKNPLLWAILIFMTLSVLSGLLNEYKTEHLMALRTNWRLMLPILLSVILADVDEERLLMIFFGFVMLISVYGIIQFFTGADWLRPDNQSFTTPYLQNSSVKYNIFHGKGNFSHHLTFGGYLLICFSLLTSLIFCIDLKTLPRLITGAIAILVLLAIGASLGRSVWLGTIITSIVLFFRYSPKLMFFLTLFLLSIGSYLYLQFSEPSFKVREPNSRIDLLEQRLISGFKIKSNQDRILMWESGINAIKDNFWLGIGYNNEAEIMPFYREKITKRTGHIFWTKASTGVHNIYLQTWINYGFIGFFGYLSIFVIFLIQCISAISKTTKFSYENCIIWAGISGVTGFMVAGFFENNFRDGEVQSILFILMGLSLLQIQKLKNRIF